MEKERSSFIISREKERENHKVELSQALSIEKARAIAKEKKNEAERVSERVVLEKQVSELSRTLAQRDEVIEYGTWHAHVFGSRDPHQRKGPPNDQQDRKRERGKMMAEVQEFNKKYATTGFIGIFGKESDFHEGALQAIYHISRVWCMLLVCQDSPCARFVIVLVAEVVIAAGRFVYSFLKFDRRCHQRHVS